MNEVSLTTEKHRHPSSGIRWLSVLSLLFVFVALAVSFALSAEAKSSAARDRAKAIHHFRQIMTAMRIYSADCSGNYPDFDVPNALTSNDVFRQMFKAGILAHEEIFGCPRSPFNPDGKIGNDIERSLALQKGENHWAVTKGQSDSTSGSMPLVYENPATATWPPEWTPWRPEFESKPSEGRAWPDHTVVVGFNDGSIEPMGLADKTAATSGLKVLPNGNPVFAAEDPSPVILNVAR